MMKRLTATSLVALATAACSVDPVATEEVAVLEQELNTCSATGLEWKPFVARLVYDAAEDFGRWEFTTDLKINGDRLAISDAGYARCASRNRHGCPSVTEGLGAQEGNAEVRTGGKLILNPMTVRSQLVAGFEAQRSNEQNAQWLSDPNESHPYNQFQSPTQTGLPHSVALTNCAVTVYQHSNFGGTSQCLRTGAYRMSGLSIGDNQISSLRVRSGMKVTLYEHDSYMGRSRVYTADSSFTSDFNDMTSSIVVTQDNVCSAIDTYQVLGAGSDWHKVRAKLVTVGYLRGNDLLDVRVDAANGTVDVDPFNVDFIPPSQVGGTVHGVKVKSPTAETWRSSDDPSPSIFPVGAACMKQPYGSTSWYAGTVRSSGPYRYCHCN
jgi:hypothetical protein